MAERVTSTVRAGNVALKDISGIMDTFIANNITLQIGRHILNHESIYAVSLNDMSHRIGIEISGLLGYSFFNNLLVTIDYRDGLIYYSLPDEDRSD